MPTCKCPHCGNDISPASLLGKGKKKTMTPAATEQRKKAAQSRWAKTDGPKIVQAVNPRTGMYIKIDRATGRIVSHKKNHGPYKGVPVVEVNDVRAAVEL